MACREVCGRRGVRTCDSYWLHLNLFPEACDRFWNRFLTFFKIFYQDHFHKDRGWQNWIETNQLKINLILNQNSAPSLPQGTHCSGGGALRSRPASTQACGGWPLVKWDVNRFCLVQDSLRSQKVANAISIYFSSTIEKLKSYVLYRTCHVKLFST